MNRVCSLHNEYCPDGKCKWCEPVAAEPETRAAVLAKTMETDAFKSIWAGFDFLSAFRPTSRPALSVTAGTAGPITFQQHAADARAHQRAMGAALGQQQAANAQGLAAWLPDDWKAP
jgi:hypothetical protein